MNIREPFLDREASKIAQAALFVIFIAYRK